MTDFPLFALSEEHQAIREAVRAVCDAKVAPYAAEADESGAFPQQAFDALAAADFAAPHIAEEYGGAGADALATCIVIEEVARACAASSLIPGVNKLGTMPIILAGSDDLKKKYLSPVAAGTGMFSYCLSEPDSRMGMEPSLFTAGISDEEAQTRATSSITMQVVTASAP